MRKRGRSNGAIDAINSERRARAELVAQRTNEAKALAGLQVETATVEGERRVVDANLGPVKYLATLLGQADELVLRNFILVVALLLDPAAVVLLMAATRTPS